MNAYIEYIQTHFKDHSHFDVTTRILECLDYIEKNIDTIAKQAGKSDLLRHPKNHLAFHLAGFDRPEIAKDQLIKLIDEVKGCFAQLLAIKDPLEQRSVIDIFLLNINDSDVGCMEARLRPALMYYGLYQSNGCQSINKLMEQFFSNIKKSEPSVKDVLDFFADKVEYQLPIQNLNNEIEPLNWFLIKGYLKMTMDWDDIDHEWIQYSDHLDKPDIIKTPRWYFHNFKDIYAAKHYLDYVKSVLPEHKQELAKAEVKFDESRKVFCFRLTQAQYQAFGLKKDLVHEKKEDNKINQSNANHLSIDKNSLINLAKKMFLSKDKKWNNLCFATENEAQQTLADIIKSIRNSRPEAIRAKVTQYNDSDTPYRFRLSIEQWQALREQKLNARFKIKTKFVIKSLRVDENNYYRRFIKMVAPPFQRYPLRVGRKQSFVVNGNGIFKRQTYQGKSDYPNIQPQYSLDQKMGFSQPQSASLGLPNFYPKVFGFDKRAQKLVGVLLPISDVLLSNRLYIYDGGSVGRPNEFFLSEDAEKYYTNKVGKILFSANNLSVFENRIQADRSKYNEVLARLRLGKNPLFFIASNTLEARLWGQEYVKILKNYLQSNNIDHTDSIRICFYNPDDPALHLDHYNLYQQQMDILEAYSIYSCEELRRQKYQENNYEILMALPDDKMEDVFKEDLNAKNVILTILSQGYVHIVQSLFEKVDGQTQNRLKQILCLELQKSENQTLLSDILYYCLHFEDKELADFIFKNSQFEKQPLKIDPEKNPLKIAAKKGYVDWINLILLNKEFSINDKDKDNETVLFIAVENDKLDSVEELLTYTNIDVNLRDNMGWTALMLASQFGYYEIVEALLKASNIDVNLKTNEGWTALDLASTFGHIKIIEALLKISNIDVNLQDNRGCTALRSASRHGHVEIVTTLLKVPNIDVNLQNQDGYNALMSALSNEIISELLKHPKIDVNLKNKNGFTALKLALNNKNSNAIVQLLNHPSIKLDSDDGFDVLMWAVKSNQRNVVKAIVGYLNKDFNLGKTNGFYVNYHDKEGLTPLMIAVDSGHLEIVAALLKTPGININDQNKEGLTAFHIANKKGHFDVMAELLLNEEIQIDVTKKEDCNALNCLAKNIKYSKIVGNFLKEHYLPNYYNKRKDEDEYKHWYGRFFGQNKNEKLKTVTKLLSDQDVSNDKGIKDGELGTVYNLLKLAENTCQSQFLTKNSY